MENNISPCVSIQSPKATLEICRHLLENRKTGAYVRFGDGEIDLMNGCSNRDHVCDPQLAKELRESMALTGEGIIKALPLHSSRFGKEPHMRRGIHEWSNERAEAFWRSCASYFIGENVYSATALHYLIVYETNYAIQFLKLLKSFSPVFVGNENLPDFIIHPLFGDGTHVKTPVRNAYGRIDAIETSLKNVLKKKQSQYHLVILSCGATAKVLAKRFLETHEFQIFFFDFGSVIELFCGSQIWTWIRLSGKPPEYWDWVLKQVSQSETGQTAPLPIA